MPPAGKADAGLTLRTATSADLTELAALDARCFAEGVSYSPDVLSFFVSGEKSRTLLAMRDGRIAGFAAAVIRSARGAHIVTIEVDPSERRKGVGTTLLMALESWAQNVSDRIFLEVDADNVPAISLYEKLDYLLAKEFEEDGQNRLAMWKALG
ncbi:MAG: GNAT family N-acetyltransferase [Acidobacteriota bacterium]